MRIGDYEINIVKVFAGWTENKGSKYTDGISIAHKDGESIAMSMERAAEYLDRWFNENF